MKTWLTIMTMVLGLLPVLSGQAASKSEKVSTFSPSAKPRPLIQIALLLDTSNSMDGLIDQARTQLWKIINEFVAMRQDGVRPELQVALFEYGNNGLSLKEGYIRQVVPLTTDLDKVSEELFALKTNGGDEYCGWVIQYAVNILAWSNNPKDYKAIFIAGNEPFTQGKIDFHGSCKTAITRRIIVNTIFCGQFDEGVSTQWKDGAILAEGKYINIDQNQKTVAIVAPQDKAIAQLGAELNKTYVTYGTNGSAGGARQIQQDANAKSASPAVMVQRAVFKSSGQYKNDAWDLVDASRNNKNMLAGIKKDDLPAEMQKMNKEEQNKYLQNKAAQREKIQKEISDLNTERNKYVAVKMKELAKSGGDTLDAAMIKAIREQAGKKSFVLSTPPVK